VAVSYDQFNKKAQLYVDGEMSTLNDYLAPSNLGDLILGSNTKYCRSKESINTQEIQGVNGLVDNVFMYKSFLSKEELDFLRISSSRDASALMTLPSSSSAAFAAHFTNDYAIKVPSSPKLSGFSQFSITFWIQLNDVSSSNIVVVDKSDRGPEYKISLQDDRVLNTRNIIVNIGANSLPQQQSNGDIWGITWQTPLSIRLDDKSWRHLGVTWDGSYVTIYLDGVVAASLGYSSYLADRNIMDSITLSVRDFSSSLFIGRSSLTTNYKRDFVIDSLSIWNTVIAINSANIKFSPTSLSQHLVVTFPFDEGYGLYSKSKPSSDNTFVVGFWTPLFDVSPDGSVKFAFNNYAISSCPIDDHIYMDENTPVSITLNGTDSRGMDFFYTFKQLPKQGKIFYMDTTSKPGVYREIVVDGALLSLSQITYVPTVNTNGLDDFSYSTATIMDVDLKEMLK